MPEHKSSAARTLAQAGLFSGLSEPELAFLAQRAVSRKFAAGTMVFSEGDPCAGMYVVESGHIRIFKTSAGVGPLFEPRRHRRKHQHHAEELGPRSLLHMSYFLVDRYDHRRTVFEFGRGL